MDSASFETLRAKVAQSLKKARHDLKFPKTEEEECARRLKEMMEDPDGTQLVWCLHFTSRLYNVRVELKQLKAALAAVEEMAAAVQGLRTGWIVAYPGVGTGGAHFFVRRYELDTEKRPTSYDPFWVEALVHDPAQREELATRVAREPGKDGYEKPLLDLARPFGTLDEAAFAACGKCRRPAPVIGYKELSHLFSSEDDDRPYPQSLHALCMECPHLTLIGRREDPAPVKLHP